MSTAPVTGSTNTTGSGAAPQIPARLLQEIRRVRHLAAPPSVTARLLAVMTEPNASVAEMLDVIRSDPAMAAKILQIVNSAFYGMPSRVTSLERAVLLLGLTAIKNLALAASLAQVFRVDAISSQFADRDLWRHCIAVATCTRLLSKQAPELEGEENFVAALVHDLGLIVALQLASKELRAAAERCYNEPQDFCVAERAEYGADHTTLGLALATHWRFPDSLRYAIACHHAPASAPAEARKVVTLIHLADRLCCAEEIGFWLTARTDPVTEALLEDIGLQPEQVDRAVNDLRPALQHTERLFRG